MAVRKLELECVEICAGSLQSAVNANDGGAKRIEFCSNLEFGGTTPSHGELVRLRDLLVIEIFVLIRPRAGHFVYNSYEHEVMIQDIEFCKTIGIDGIVTGALNADGTLDLHQTKQFKIAAGDLPIVFHRAIDEVVDPVSGIQNLINLGYQRILTSGGKTTAFEGREVIKKMVEASKGHIEIMAGSGVNPENIESIINSTGVTQIHTSASENIDSDIKPGIFWNPNMKIRQTSTSLVRKMIRYQKKSR